MKKAKKILFIILTLLIMIPVFSAYAKSYKGKVIDAETGEPIEGAVVMLIWYRNHAFSGSDYFKSREILTDKSGMFYLKGRNKINFYPVTRVGEPHLHIFKGGYKYFMNPWVLSVFKKDYMKKKISFEDDLVIFKLKKLTTNEERMNDIPYISSEVPFEKRKLFMEELNKEEIHLGLEPSKF